MIPDKVTYGLSVEKEGANRLVLSNDVYGFATSCFISPFVKPGDNVLEVASGTGHVATWLSQKVGKNGFLHAIDINPSQVERTAFQLKNTPNARVETRSVDDLDSLPKMFDVIHCRHLLIHMEDPLGTIQHMLTPLKKGGLLICEEYAMSHAYCNPNTATYALRQKLALGYFLQKGLDPDIGDNLSTLMKAANLDIIKEDAFQPTLESPDHKKLIPLFIEEIKDELITIGLISKGDIDMHITKLNDLILHNEYTFKHSKMFQMCAMKKD